MGPGCRTFHGQGLGFPPSLSSPAAAAVTVSFGTTCGIQWPEPTGGRATQTVPDTGMSLLPCPVVYQDKLYVFHQGLGTNGSMRYNVLDGKSWQGELQVPGVVMSEAPAVAVLNRKLYCFYQGGGNDGTLWWSGYDGKKWEKSVKVEGVGLSLSPSAVTVGSDIWVFHRGGGDVNEL